MQRPSAFALLLLGVSLVCARAASSQAPQGEEVAGTVVAVRAELRELVIVDRHHRQWVFRVSRVARVMINNRPARFAELGAGDTLRVHYQAADKHLLATEIHAMQM